MDATKCPNCGIGGLEFFTGDKYYHDGKVVADILLVRCVYCGWYRKKDRRENDGGKHEISDGGDIGAGEDTRAGTD